MKKILLILLLLAAPLGIVSAIPSPAPTVNKQICKKPFKIRMLIFKHSREYIADNDAALALEALKEGADKGLNIKSIGEHYFTEPVNGIVSSDIFTRILLDPDEDRKWQSFQSFISESLKIDASFNDLVIVFSIGHGGADGHLHNIGLRSKVMTALANAAEENNQKVIWWQLSCHASAGLPAISSLPESQQKLFSIIASSNAQEESSVNVQGKIMSKLFHALVTNSSSIDLNGDGVVVAKELESFFKGSDIPHDGGGPIVYSLKPETMMFGWKGFGIPVIDRNSPQGEYAEDYIPVLD